MSTEVSLEQILDSAEDALNEGTPDVALELCAQVLDVDPSQAGAWYLKGEALRAIGALSASAEAYQKAALLRPSHAPSWTSWALSAYETLALNDAWRAINRALREDPNNPHSWWVRALLLEWKGDINGSRRAMAHAQWLDPANFPMPPQLDEGEIGQIVSDAISELHPTLIDFLTNVPIIVEDLPSEETLTAYDPPASPLDLLGYFSGASLQERSLEDPWSHLPPTIVLFRRNLERSCNNRTELIHQLRVTLYHEVGHFLGLNEDDLVKRGLD